MIKEQTTRKFINRFIIYLFAMITLLLLIESAISSNEDGPRGWAYVYNGKIDVMIIGSSHVHYGVDAPYISQETGKDVVLLSSGFQNMETIYYNLLEVLKYQHPDIIMIDAYSIIYDYLGEATGDDLDAVIRINLDGMRPSLIKYRAAIKMLGFESYTVFETLRKDNSTKLYNFIKNPNKLAMKDVPLNTERGFEPHEHGEYVSDDLYEGRLNIEIDDNFILPEENLMYLEKVITICEEEQIPLEIIKIPVLNRSEYYSGLYALDKFFIKIGKSVPVINLMDEKYGLDLRKHDYFDYMHLSDTGARELAIWMVQYLKDYYKFE